MGEAIRFVHFKENASHANIRELCEVYYPNNLHKRNEGRTARRTRLSDIIQRISFKISEILFKLFHHPNINGNTNRKRFDGDFETSKRANDKRFPTVLDDIVFCEVRTTHRHT